MTQLSKGLGKTTKVTIRREGVMCLIPVTFDPKSVFGKVRSPVKVTLNGYTYQSPKDLKKALVANGHRRKNWDSWSYTRRREVAEAIEGAKKPETRARRVAAALSALD